MMSSTITREAPFPTAWRGWPREALYDAERQAEEDVNCADGDGQPKEGEECMLAVEEQRTQPEPASAEVTEELPKGEAERHRERRPCAEHSPPPHAGCCRGRRRWRTQSASAPSTSP